MYLVVSTPIFGSNSQTPITSGNAFAIYFDKHFMQDYPHDGVNLSGSQPPMLGGPYTTLLLLTIKPVISA